MVTTERCKCTHEISHHLEWKVSLMTSFLWTFGAMATFLRAFWAFGAGSVLLGLWFRAGGLAWLRRGARRARRARTRAAWWFTARALRLRVRAWA